ARPRRGPRTAAARASRAAETLRDADEVAFAIADGKRRRVAGILTACRRLHPLLGRAGDRPPVADARAQFLDMLVAQQAREFLRRRIVAVDAHAGGESDRAID